MNDKTDTRRSYKLLAPLTQGGEDKTPKTHPTVPLRAEQAKRLAEQGVVEPTPVAPVTPPAIAGKQE